MLFGSTSLHCWPEAVAAHAQAGLGQARPGHGTSAGSECSSAALVVVDEGTVKAQGEHWVLAACSHCSNALSPGWPSRCCTVSLSL